MNGFQANPEGLMAKGKNITGIYEGYTIQKDKVYKTKEEVSRAWAGADSAGYVTAIDSYEADFKQLGAVVAQIGDILYRHGSRLAQSRDSIRDAASRL